MFTHIHIYIVLLNHIQLYTYINFYTYTCIKCKFQTIYMHNIGWWESKLQIL
jgi:hypothetical protein